MLCIKLTKIKGSNPGATFYLKDLEHTSKIKKGERIYSHYFSTDEVSNIFAEEKFAIVETKSSIFRLELVEIDRAGHEIVHYWS